MTILLVEDDADFRDALTENLEDDGFQVRVYESAEEVPPVATLGDVDVVVADYRLPGQSGLRWADAFHQCYPMVPVIVITADPSPDLDVAVHARSHVVLRRKPLNYADLSTLIHHA